MSILFVSRFLYNQIITSLEKIQQIVNETHTENILMQFQKIEEEQTESTFLTVLLRSFATPTHHLLEDTQSEDYLNMIIKGLTLKDVAFVLSSKILYIFVHAIKWTGNDFHFKNAQDMHHFINYLYGSDFGRIKPADFPDEFISFEGINYFVTNTDCFDLLKKKEESGLLSIFIIDTTILNTYELKPGLRKIGGRGKFQLQQDGFHLIQLEYEDQEYLYMNCPSEKCKIALYSFYCGIKSFITITSHLINTHILISAKTTSTTRKYLAPADPLRILLLPTELNTLNSAGRAIPTLLRKDFCIHHIFSFTFDGLKTLIRDYLQNRNESSEYTKYMSGGFMTWLDLSESELSCPPFRDVYLLFNEISSFVEAFVDKYEEIFGMDHFALDLWCEALLPSATMPKTEKIKCIVGYMYFLQIRHALMSNNCLTYISNNYPSVIPLDSAEAERTFYTVTQQFEQFIISSGTSLKWITMKLNLSNLLQNKDKELKVIFDTFYNRLQEIQITNPLLQPCEIGISTGL